MAAIPHAQAGTWTWSGNGGNVNWGQAGNWGSGAPTSAATTDLVFTGSTNTGSALTPLNQNVANPFQLNTLTFNSLAGTFFLGGSALSFTGATSTITQSSSNGQSIANNMSATATLGLSGNGTGTVILSGVISGGTSISKNGTSTFTLLGANTYTGSTTISGGILNIQNGAALGTTGSGTTVAGGAQLQLQGGITVGNEALTLNGTGISSDGALRNISGANSVAGAVTMASATTIHSDAGTLTLSGAFNNGGFLLAATGNGNLAFTGLISGAGGLTKDGTGTLTLGSGSNASSNSFTGATTVNDGTLVLNLKLAKNAFGGTLTVGDGAGAANSAVVRSMFTGQLPANAVSINADGQLDLNNFNESIGTLSMTGGNVTTGTGTLTLGGNVTGNAAASTATITGLLALGGNRSFMINDGAVAVDMNITAAVSGAFSFTKAGSGELVLSGANSYTGLTTVSSGVLNIQNSSGLGTTASGTTISLGAALQLQGGIAVGTEAITLNGSGIASDGALRSISGNNSYAGVVTFGSASTIASDAATLTLSGAIINGGFAATFAGSGNVISSGVLSGTGGLTKNGGGTLTLSGINTYSGGSTLNGGVTIINSSSSLGAVGGPATINGATLEVAATFTSTRNLILGNASSTILVDPAFAFTVNGIVSGAGTLNKTGAGTIILGGGNTYGGTTNVSAGILRLGTTNVIPDASAVTVSSGATLDLNGFSETLGSLAGGGTVTSGAAGSLTLTAGGDNTSTIFSGVLQNGSGTVAFTKSGTGTLTLSGSNTYSGLTTINAGILDIQNANGLGTTAGSTTVVAGATLQLQSGISLGGEPLTLNGTGYSGNGAMRNLSGNNSYAGSITLGSASTISSDAGTLTLSGGITNGGFTSTFMGAGNIFEGGIVSGSGGVTKNGAGTLTLGGANTYLGNTTINGGTVAVSTDGNLGALSSAITVNAGTLEIATGFSTSRAISLGNSASTFQVDAGQIFTVNLAITGTGTLNKTGAGTMVLSAVNLFSGGTSVIAGTLQLGANDRLLSSAGLTIGGGTFDLQTFNQTTGAVTLSSGSITGTGTATVTGSSYDLQSGTVTARLAGNGTVTKTTTGTVTLSGSNTFSGSTTISAGTLQVNTNNALGTAASGTTVASGAVLTLNNVNYSTAEPLTLNGTGISNGGALHNTGTSTFAGPINAATNATINAGGGTLNLTGGLSKNGTTLTIAGGGTVNINTNGISGASPNSDLVVDGVTVNENTANSYNGPTYIRNGGILNANVVDALPTSNGRSPIILDDTGTGASKLTLGAPQAAASLTGASSSSIGLNGNTLTVGTSSGTTTFAGTISGTGGLIKDGTSIQIVTGANTYSGSTTVNGGTLTVANGSGSALASTSNVTVNSGGTFLLGATDQVNNTATMTLGGGSFGKGNFSEGSASAPGVGALTLTASGSHIDFGTDIVGVLTFASFTPGAFMLTVDNWTGTANTVGDGSTDRLIFASDQSANLSSFSFTGFSGVTEVDLLNGYWEVIPLTAVPEPSMWLAGVLGLAVAGADLLRRRAAVRRRAARQPAVRCIVRPKFPK
jgi:fibronectin-binding autotransporter adhesin